MWCAARFLAELKAAFIRSREVDGRAEPQLDRIMAFRSSACPRCIRVSYHARPSRVELSDVLFRSRPENHMLRTHNYVVQMYYTSYYHIHIMPT
jgi:hypothetical protein